MPGRTIRDRDLRRDAATALRSVGSGDTVTITVDGRTAAHLRPLGDDPFVGLDSVAMINLLLNAETIVAAVETGRSFTVTMRGRAIARLVPPGHDPRSCLDWPHAFPGPPLPPQEPPPPAAP